jgi:hypothetical protein
VPSPDRRFLHGRRTGGRLGRGERSNRLRRQRAGLSRHRHDGGFRQPLGPDLLFVLVLIALGSLLSLVPALVGYRTPVGTALRG